MYRDEHGSVSFVVPQNNPQALVWMTGGTRWFSSALEEATTCLFLRVRGTSVSAYVFRDRRYSGLLSLY